MKYRFTFNTIFLKIIIFAFLLFLSCKNSSINTAELFSNWFINGKSIDKTALVKQIRSIKELDKIISDIKKIEPRESDVVLKDEFGADFVLGYKIPKTNDTQKKLPLIIYLHGGTGTIATDKGRITWQMLSFLTDSIDVVIASPSANRESPWWSTRGMNRILQSVRYMTLNSNIDPDKIFLAGVSDGGTACYAAANCIPAPFAGFIAISGFGAAVENFGISLQPANLAQSKIYNVNAGLDRLYPVEYIQAFLDQLTNAGVNIEQKLYPTENHGFDYRLQETNKLLDILRTWKKSGSNKYLHIFSSGFPNYANGIISAKVLIDAKTPYFSGWFSDDSTLVIKSDGIETATISTDKKAGSIVRISGTMKNKSGIKIRERTVGETLDAMFASQNPVNDHKNSINLIRGKK